LAFWYNTCWIIVVYVSTIPCQEYTDQPTQWLSRVCVYVFTWICHTTTTNF
jgi:hypothetical protein